MKRELLIKTLNRLRDEHEKYDQLLKLKVDILELNDGLINCLIEMFCLLIGEKGFDDNLELLQWWLYDQPNKIFYYDDKRPDRDVNSPENFVDFLLENQ